MSAEYLQTDHKVKGDVCTRGVNTPSASYFGETKEGDALPRIKGTETSPGMGLSSPLGLPPSPASIPQLLRGGFSPRPAHPLQPCAPAVFTKPGGTVFVLRCANPGKPQWVVFQPERCLEISRETSGYNVTSTLIDAWYCWEHDPWWTEGIPSSCHVAHLCLPFFTCQAPSTTVSYLNGEICFPQLSCVYLWDLIGSVFLT